MLKKLSFKMKLLLSILPMVIVGMLVLSGTALYQFRKTIQDEIISDRASETNKLSENVNAWWVEYLIICQIQLYQKELVKH